MEPEIGFLVETEGVLCEPSAVGTAALHTGALEMTLASDGSTTPRENGSTMCCPQGQWC